jgi:hypothetical protein
VRRWRYVMAPTSCPGIWKLKDGGYFVRVRVTDPRTGRRGQCARALRVMTVTIWDAIRVRDRLRHEGCERRQGDDPVPAALERVRSSVVRGKVAEGKLSSSTGRDHWGARAHGEEALVELSGVVWDLKAHRADIG